jgi:hypothetical protein
MPFTFSHPAIVLPLTYLNRKWFSLTGLVIGSLTPDFEYFIRMKVQSNYSHTLSGIFWFDLPLGILLTFIFHNIIKKQLFNNLPTKLRNKISPFILFDWNKYFKENLIVIISSIVIGAFSHIFWDSFTHETGYFVVNISALKSEINLLGKQLPFYKILQHLSSLIGGIIVVFSLYSFKNENPNTSKINMKYWFLVSILTLTIFLIRFFVGLEINQIGNIIVSAIASTLLALTLTPLLLTKKYNWW